MCSYSKYSLFPHPFCQKMKKVKSLKIENFDQVSEKRTPPNSGQFGPDPYVSTIQRFDRI